VQSHKPILALLSIALAIGLGIARGQSPQARQGEQAGDPLIVVSQRVDLKMSATGRRLGWLGSGARVDELDERRGWVRVQIRGWMPTRSLRTSGDETRIAPLEETLHVAPSGRVIGGLGQQVEVRTLRSGGGWSEVTRIGWVPARSVAAAPAPRGAARDREPALTEGSTVSSAIGRLAQRVELRGAPEGAALAELPAGTVVASHETRGGWTRVSVQGWVPSAAVQAGASDEAGPDVVAAAGPEVFVGRRMRWTLEHVALQRADRARTDFAPGELFALARVPGRSDLYVYLVVSEQLASAFRGLEPFATVRVEGRVRAGRSALTGHPILDVERILP
jgi:hypothetical protein